MTSRPLGTGYPHGPMGGVPLGIPGVDLIQTFFTKLGVDPTYLGGIMMGLALLSNLGGFFNYICSTVQRLWAIVASNLVSSAEIHSSDQAFVFIMRWLAVHRISTDCREFRVSSAKNLQSTRFKRFSMYENANKTQEPDDDEEEEDDLGPKLKYNPSAGLFFFFFRGHFIIMQRKDDKAFFHGDAPDETITLKTIGRSPRVLRLLLKEARDEYLTYRARARKTLVFGVRKADGIYGHQGGMCWDVGRSKTSRDIKTVIMEDRDKDLILRDTREYLNPVTARWYAARGLPYRRGYLFHGPPGTGKTSLTLALAGELKLNLYIFNLASSEVTDEILGQLFLALPKKCIVLLEDIDCAGVGKRGEQKAPKSWPQSNGAADTIQQKASEFKSSGSAVSSPESRPSTRRAKDEGVTLSGLLNAIDGVASHEGRILIMTTNHREQLDPALIRPGRVDVEIELSHSSTESIRRIFTEIYNHNEPSKRDPEKPGDLSKPAPPKTPEVSESYSTTGTPSTLASAEIEALAKQFGDAVPPYVFTPAELQGFLIQHKLEPERAVLEVKQWVTSMLKQKSKSSDPNGDAARELLESRADANATSAASMHLAQAENKRMEEDDLSTATMDYNSGASTACDSETSSVLNEGSSEEDIGSTVNLGRKSNKDVEEDDIQIDDIKAPIMSSNRINNASSTGSPPRKGRKSRSRSSKHPSVGSGNKATQ
ncbi:hypothetical protein DFH27DRAFT_216771 [Peziza echinospora]|nr:hypothetical protein DFH27DRAFT_216771 [Peziza echinospora]